MKDNTFEQAFVRPPSRIPKNLKSRDRAKVVDRVGVWVRANFEPTVATPASSAEIGMLPVMIVIEHFSDVLSEDLIIESAILLDQEATTWVVSSKRLLVDRQAIYANDLDDILDDAVDNVALHHRSLEESVPIKNLRALNGYIEKSHSDMLAKINELEALIAVADPVTSRIGHNLPPEEFGVPPYSDEESRTISKSLEILKSQPAALQAPSNEAQFAAINLKRIGMRVVHYLAALGDRSATSFADGLGKGLGMATGASIIGFTLWQSLGDKLIAVAKSAEIWMRALGIWVS